MWVGGEMIGYGHRQNRQANKASAQANSEAN